MGKGPLGRIIRSREEVTAEAAKKHGEGAGAGGGEDSLEVFVRQAICTANRLTLARQPVSLLGREHLRCGASLCKVGLAEMLPWWPCFQTSLFFPAIKPSGLDLLRHKRSFLPENKLIKFYHSWRLICKRCVRHGLWCVPPRRPAMCLEETIASAPPRVGGTPMRKYHMHCSMAYPSPWPRRTSSLIRWMWPRPRPLISQPSST